MLGVRFLKKKTYQNWWSPKHVGFLLASLEFHLEGPTLKSRPSRKPAERHYPQKPVPRAETPVPSDIPWPAEPVPTQTQTGQLVHFFLKYCFYHRGGKG